MNEVDGCSGLVERWWSNLCEHHRAGFAWWDCPPKPYLRRAFQLLGLLLSLFAQGFRCQGFDPLSVRAYTLRVYGYWMGKPQFDAVLAKLQSLPRGHTSEES